MNRFALLVEYDGSAFAGFQRQTPGGPSTVQGALETALSRLVAHPVTIKAAGRTDAGVHATGQVVAFETTAQRTLDVLLRGANALLPESVRVLAVRPVSEAFHPRFSALRRVYHYHLLPEMPHELFFARRLWAMKPALDWQAMGEAARGLVGSHDFSSYCSGVPAEETRQRDLWELRVVEPGGRPDRLPFGRLRGLGSIELEANAFLRKMVRMLVASLVKVGLGEWPVERPRQVLEARDPARAAPPAPPDGLYLVRVDYPPELLSWS